MGDKTGISWTDATWNPIRGCSRVSTGCVNCYAERVAMRFSGKGQPYDGLVRFRARNPGDDNPKPIGWSGAVRFIPEHLADPLRWRKPRRIFVNSMSDMFHEELANEQIAAVFGVMAAAPQHTFQILTKRARRMREWFEWVHAEFLPDELNADRIDCLATWAADELGDGSVGDQERWFERVRGLIQDAHADFPHDVPWPLPNVWLGVSTENQEAADERIPELLGTPAAVRFISAEPLLGPIDLDGPPGSLSPLLEVRRGDLNTHGAEILIDRPRLDWVITGCESGNGARPCDVAWLRSLRDQCAAAGVPYFLKQGVRQGGVFTAGPGDGHTGLYAGDGSKRKQGGVIELPYLDGVQHAAMPEGRP